MHDAKRSPAAELLKLTHPFFQANAWLVMNDTHAILIDTASNDSADADRVARWVTSTGRTLQAIVVSHGHPDIWLGVRRLREVFPATPIFAATREIRDDVIAMGNVMESAGMLARTPELSPTRYDYEKAIRLLDGPTLFLEGSPRASLQMRVTDRPSEHTRITTIFIPELSALVVSDLAYNHVHAWCGIGVDRHSVQNWLQILDGLIRDFGRPGIRVFAGHGPETDANVLYAQRAYLRTVLEAIDAGKEGAALRAAIKDAFPGHLGRDFQLDMTVQNRAALAR